MRIRIRDAGSFSPLIWFPGFKKQRISDPDPQHWKVVILRLKSVYCDRSVSGT
jgi:hypothetical protein